MDDAIKSLTEALAGWIFFIIVVVIFKIILFFKMWDMTNDVRKMKEMMIEAMDVEYERETPEVTEEKAVESKLEQVEEIEPIESNFWVWNKVPFRREKKVISEDPPSQESTESESSRTPVGTPEQEAEERR